VVEASFRRSRIGPRTRAESSEPRRSNESLRLWTMMGSERRRLMIPPAATAPAPM
jgi:hypothetical protein